MHKIRNQHLTRRMVNTKWNPPDLYNNTAASPIQTLAVRYLDFKDSLTLQQDAHHSRAHAFPATTTIYPPSL